LKKSAETREYSEFLKQKKVKDKIEQKRIEKEKLKQELGNYTLHKIDYEFEEVVFDCIVIVQKGEDYESSNESFGADNQDDAKSNEQEKDMPDPEAKFRAELFNKMEDLDNALNASPNLKMEGVQRQQTLEKWGANVIQIQEEEGVKEFFLES